MTWLGDWCKCTLLYVISKKTFFRWHIASQPLKKREGSGSGSLPKLTDPEHCHQYLNKGGGFSCFFYVPFRNWLNTAPLCQRILGRIQDCCELRLWHWHSDALTTRLDLIHNRLDLIHTRLHLIHNRLDLIHNRLDLIHNRRDLIHKSARSHPQLLDLIHNRLDLIHNRLGLIHINICRTDVADEI